MALISMKDIDLQNKRVLMRVDFNVPLKEGRITSDTRIRTSLPGIQLALAKGARLMLMSHLGRPEEGKFTAEDSLLPIAKHLEYLLNQPVRLIQNWLDEPISVAQGEVLLLENVRFNRGENVNDAALARKMAALCDVFVMDAFATSHRAQASTYGVAEYAPLACAGPLVLAEIDALTKALQAPKRPLVAIVGGAKVSTKFGILEHLSDKVDSLIVGGGIANTFLAAQRINIGRSLCEPDWLPTAKTILTKMQQAGKALPLPQDVVVAKAFSEKAEAWVKDVHKIAADDMILDIGPKTAAHFASLLKAAGTIVWNGPVGVFEFPAFAKGTETISQAVAQSPAFSLAGGGDTIAAIEQFKVESAISYISTAGGAFLEFLEGKTLPALAILEQRGNV